MKEEQEKLAKVALQEKAKNEKAIKDYFKLINKMGLNKAQVNNKALKKAKAA